MFKKLIAATMILTSSFGTFAQMPQLTPLPVNPEVKTGVLPNGLTYYVLHNEEPKERANFYIAQKVGSTLETPEQLGLAHFLEHMAFNGTTHYPGKNLLEYLQSKGIRFGADINAYTAFDQTVYNVDNVPTNDIALMDSVLLILRDWSCDILLAEDEIEAERGVIREEWRQRNNAQNRMFTTILPQIFEEYQYQQMPIGSMDVVMNFKPETLRAYYKKWYRPDQQGIVVVGDFDAAEMEKKIIDLFSTITMPADAAERTYPTVSDNQSPIVALYEDPELQLPMATISFKFDKVPDQFRSTVEVYLEETVLRSLISAMLNERLAEYSHNPNCAYAQAGVYFGNFYVAKTKGAFNVALYAKSDINAAISDAMGVVARACSTGFTDGELSRAKDKLMAQYENAYNERNKTSNSARGEEIINHFVDNEAMPGIETEYALIQQVLPSLPVEVINQFAGNILTKENQVIVVSQPKAEGYALPEKATVIETVEGALNATYEALEEQKIEKPLIEKLRKPGKISKIDQNNGLGLQTLTLSNGVKVIVKSTDFSADQVLLTAFRNGGKRSYAPELAPEVLLMSEAYDYSKLGNYDVNTLRRYLAGKKLTLSYNVGIATNYLEGSSTVKDLPTLFELLYASFTSLGNDKATYQAQIEASRSYLANAEKDPSFIFSSKMNDTRYDNNPMMANLTVADLDAADYDRMLGMLRQSMANAADFTFIFTGNIDVETLRPMLEKYIASLPSKKKASKTTVVKEIETAAGQIKQVWKQPMQTPSVNVFDIYSGDNLAYNTDNAIRIKLIGDVLDIIYTATLREEEGGTYGAQCGGQMNPNSDQWCILYTFQTNEEQQDALVNRAHKELINLLENGTNEDIFNKVKGAALKQYEINVRTNEYWNANLLTYARGWNVISDHQQALEKLTLDDFNAFMKKLYNGKNRIQIIMEGVSTESE